MLREDEDTGAAFRAAPKIGLAIRYPRGRSGSNSERQMVYVCQGIPPITAAEIEIMREHLEESARAVSATAKNDNF